MSLKKIALASLTVIVVLLLFAQKDDIKFMVEGRVSSDDGKIEGATITLFMDGTRQEVTSPPRNGRFGFELEYNHEYRLVFNRDGFFQKIIIISTFVPTEVLQRNNKFPPYPFELNFFKQTDIIDRSFTMKPVARVFYNSKIDNFDAEVYLSDAQLREQIQAAEAERDALASEQRSIGRANEQELATLERQYDKAIADADGFYHQKDYERAIGRFRDALMIFGDRSYPKDRIAEIQDLMAALKLTEETEQQYLAAIQTGDQQFNGNQYSEAISWYEKALEYKPKDKYATTRIEESRKLLKDRQDDMQYNDLIARADQAFNTLLYHEAKALYQQAIDRRPRDSQYARDQIKKIELELARLAKLKETEEQYAAAMQQGNTFFTATDYPGALAAFKGALALKPGDEPAQERIRTTEAAIRQLAEDKKYDELIAQADELFSKKQLPAARAGYQQALNVKPNEQHPRERITEIDRQIQLNQQLNRLLTEANNSFTRKEYINAKTKYQQVLALQADHELSKSRIAEIDARLAEVQHQQEVLAEVNQAYQAAIRRGDDAFSTSNFEKATDAYNEAHLLKAEEEYPIKQLAEIERLKASALEQAYQKSIAKADDLFSQTEYTLAKPEYQHALLLKANDGYATRQIATIDRKLQEAALADAERQKLDAAYAAKIEEADQAFSIENYTGAKLLYRDALALKANAQYPAGQIAKIDAILAELARQTELNTQYSQMMASAKTAFDREQFGQALNLYKQAAGLKPLEPEPPQRINEIEQILAQRAEETRLAETERRQKAREDSIAAARFMAFNTKIKEAVSYVASRELENAVASYQEAITILPEKSGEVQPKIDELKNRMLQRAQNEASYQAAIRKGDGQFNREEWNEAKSSYQEAAGLKPEEDYPKKQLERINLKIKEPELLAEKARTTDKTNDDYNEAIKVADENFGKTAYAVAQFYYQKALSFQPENPYPQQRLDEISKLIDQSLAANQIEAYNEAIAKADLEFDRKGYTLARFYYNKALEIKSWEQYPKDRIRAIGRLTNSLLSQREEQNYLDWINTADEAFVNKDFAVARSYYQRAQTLKKDEPYPGIKLAEIQKELEKMQAAETEKEYRNAISEADNAFEGKNYSVARFYYNKALSLRPNEQYPKDRLQLIREILEDK
jgi:tetratricopeptide (TPR) repeat protein